MAEQIIEADYVIIGAGAAGMAFADAMMASCDDTFVIVDRRHRPGGHWNDAYPFVRLHQPAHFYGVTSKRLGQNRIEDTGLNRGMYELASGPEIVTYFDEVMRHRLLPSGRLQYFPMSNFDADNHISSLVSGERRRLRARKKLVDATYLQSSVPSTHRPTFSVAPDVQCVPLNSLPRITRAHPGYVVIGAGKTGVDACLWLLENRAAPERIHWIMPRDAWMLNRAKAQFTETFFEASAGSFLAQLEAIVGSETIDHVFARLESLGELIRIDPRVKPTAYHGATISTAEAEDLRRIDNVIRLGRVQRIDRTEIVLDRGIIPAASDWLYVDCSALGLPKRPPIPVFAANKITIQPVKMLAPTFSAAFIGHLEAVVGDDEKKNALCTVIPHPDIDADWLANMATSLMNQYRWSKDPDLTKWMAGCRLDPHTAMYANIRETETEKLATRRRSGQLLGPATAKLQALLANAPA